ncbi:response regulator [Cohnella sp. GCM10027633]|uniref:response regulator n=1 Tax=unclassified Cohnella TaxID=2636738 RepID=UPI00362B123D
MLKAVLFDDEYIVVEALSALVDWEGLGIELAGTASDGFAALELFRSVKPHIILTDIRMPGMDGLQLLDIVMEEAPDTSCIVFSGFNEFEYVKRSIQLGVSDYIEKPITEKSIEQALRKVLGEIRKQEHAKLLERQWKDSQKELLEKATLDLLRYGEKARAKWEACMAAEMPDVYGITVVVSMEEFRLPEHGGHLVIAVRNGDEHAQAIVHRDKPEQPLRDEIRSAAELAEIEVGIGNTHVSPGFAIESYRQAQRALKAALYLRMKSAIQFDELGTLFSVPRGLNEREEAILLSLRAGSASGLLHQVERFVAWIYEEKLDPDLAEQEMLKLVYLALDIASESASDDRRDDSLRHNRMLHVDIREAAAHGRLHEWFRGQFATIAEWMNRDRKHRTHASIENAIVYIERQLSRDVSLQEVAAHVGLNPTYFSVLFKEETGQTYIKYLTRCRMEKAKVLLRKGMKITEVSESVGYLAHRHFADVFRKYTGVTPGQYKERQSEKTDARS